MFDDNWGSPVLRNTRILCNRRTAKWLFITFKHDWWGIELAYMIVNHLPCFIVKNWVDHWNGSLPLVRSLVWTSHSFVANFYWYGESSLVWIPNFTALSISIDLGRLRKDLECPYSYAYSCPCYPHRYPHSFPYSYPIVIVFLVP